MSRRMAATLGLTLVTGLWGCRDKSPTTASDTSTSTSTAAAAVTPTVIPDPAASRTSTDPGYEWATSFNVTLTQSGSTAITIRALSADLQQAAGGIVVAPPANLDEAFRFQVKAGGNTLPAAGTVAIDFDFAYTLPNGGREALVTITLTLVDDQGVSSTKTVQVRVV